MARTQQPTYLDLQARIGITKHTGGYPATERLLEQCRVREASEVLYVGSGIGVGPAHLARTRRCRVVAIDISEQMLEWTRMRARRDHVAHLVSTERADVLSCRSRQGTSMSCSSSQISYPASLANDMGYVLSGASIPDRGSRSGWPLQGFPAPRARGNGSGRVVGGSSCSRTRAGWARPAGLIRVVAIAPAGLDAPRTPVGVDQRMACPLPPRRCDAAKRALSGAQMRARVLASRSRVRTPATPGGCVVTRWTRHRT